MIEEISEYRNLRKLEHKLLCTQCMIEMQMEEMVYLTDPLKYPYICPQCGNKIIAQKSYPYTEIIGEFTCTYQQEIT